MIHKKPKGNMSREAWLTERRKGIGGSDMGAILGMSTWGSPYSVWAEKTGKVVKDDSDNEAMRIGRDLEQYVADRFCEASGKKVRRVNAMITNTDYPHLLINIDREVVGESAILECKTANAFGAKRFRGGAFPENYYAQCVTYMAVYERARCYLAVLVMGLDFKIFMMTTDPDDEKPEWCEGMVYVDSDEFDTVKGAALEFWEYVETKTEPPIDGLKPTTDTISELYPESDPDKQIDLGLVRHYIQARTSLEAQIKLLKEEKETYDNHIKNYFKDAEKGFCDGFRVTYKSQSRTTVDTKKLKEDHPEIDFSKYEKVSTSRPLRITEIKED